MTVSSSGSIHALILFPVLMLGQTSELAAQGDVFNSADDYQFEQINPVTLEAPEPPSSRVGPGPEGWIKLRFTINSDGTTDNIEILDFMPSAFSRRNTENAVESWTFNPAMVDGEAVEWHNNIVVVNFDLPQIPNISGPQFTTPYAEVEESINEGDYDRAARRASNNLRNSTFTLHDIGLGNIQLAIIEMRREDMHTAHQAITRATIAEVTQLTNEELDVALQYRFNIEVQLGRYMDALDTYDRRAALGMMADDDIMHEQSSQIRDAIDQGFTLNAQGKILDRGEGWFFVPTRRTFAIANVEGDVDSIDVVCNRRIISLEYQADVEWSLPESWGDCSLTVQGNRNTTFTFYEFTGA